MGANLGDKAGQVKSAVQALGRLPETRLVAASSLYRTAPVGKTDQDWFVNAAALVETGLEPERLLEELLALETRMGRVRTEKWGPRVIDLDILFFGRLVMNGEGLILPHPFLPERRFVLEPLAEVAPEWRHPVTGLTPARMLEKIGTEGQEVFRL